MPKKLITDTTDISILSSTIKSTNEKNSLIKDTELPQIKIKKEQSGGEDKTINFYWENLYIYLKYYIYIIKTTI